MERPMSPTFDDFAPQHTSTPGPSSIYKTSHTSGPSRKRHSTQTSDYYSQLGSPEEAILEESVSWLRRAKKARIEKNKSSSELTRRLSALTAGQLASVIAGLVKQHPDLEEVGTNLLVKKGFNKMMHHSSHWTGFAINFIKKNLWIVYLLSWFHCSV